MAVQLISAEQAARNLGGFDAVLDARSPVEFAQDHLPGAENWPVLDNDERVTVGTAYKQVSAFEARKTGAALVARRVADLIDARTPDKPRTWRPLVYCWRGGDRSGTLAWFLDRIGYRVQLVQGGYKAFRSVVRDDLASWPLELDWVVVAGPTGSGKTRLLQALASEGAQTLDLEALAAHRGSVLGGLPGTPQPSQKAFETRVWHALSCLDRRRPVYVESESLKIGSRQVPAVLIEQMRERGRCALVQAPDGARVALLLQEYAHFRHDAPGFCQLLESLTPLRGAQTVQRWQSMAHAGDWSGVFTELMQQHYDPLYRRSTDRNYRGITDAHRVDLPDLNEKTLREAAQGLMQSLGG